MRSLATDQNYNREQNKKSRRISLKWKWTLGASLAIFLTYSIFSVATFLGFRQIMMREENEEMREVLYGVTDRLNYQSETLSKATVYHAMNPSYVPLPSELGDDYDRRFLVFGQSSNYQDTLYARMSGEGVTVRVYSPASRLLFESRPNDLGFESSNQPIMETIEVDGEEALIGISPVYSNLNQELIGYVQVINELVYYHQMSERMVNAIVIIGTVALLVSGILGYFLAWKFLQPIKQITGTMNDIRKDTQSSSRIAVDDRNDELVHLSIVFNDMMDKMQKYIEQQKQFVEDVSHELRTPVAVMEGHLKLLNRWGKDDPEILEESLSASLQEVGRMKVLVQEMLDLSRAEQVEIHYKNEKTAIKPIVWQTYNNFKMIHPDFVFNMDDAIKGDVYVQIYRNHLEQILIILLDNAVKYSTDRKEVHLSIATEGNKVQIAVQDFGEGMTPEDTEKIFNRFYRVDKARSRHKGGNGLGLAIARELLNGYNGNIVVDSVLDYGSIFRITLPIYEVREKTEQVTEE